MGQKLARFYAQAEATGGLAAKIKLATLTRISSTQAEAIADTPDVVERFEKALAGLKPDGGSGARLPPEAALEASATPAVLRAHISIFLDLMAQRSVYWSDRHGLLARVTEAAARGLQVARASVWFLEQDGQAITCADLFEAEAGKHSSGITLHAKDFPPYFLALRTERTIAAHDAHKDPRTSCFSVGYLTPLGINSMLDVPIWVHGRMVGVVCHEHVGVARRWSQDDENFAYLMSNLAGLALERLG